MIDMTIASSCAGDIHARVVLVDDHQLLSQGIAELLHAAPDIEIVGHASNGHDAVALTSRLLPDIVLMDVAMPGMGGVAATERIIAGGWGARVIGLSGHDEPRLVAAMLDAGASGYLLKSCACDELVYALRVTMRNHSYLSPAIAGAVVAGFRAHHRAGRGAFATLTDREREITVLLAQGRTTKEVAAQLGVSPKTIGTHREHAMRKLSVRTIADLTRQAIEAGVA